MGKTAIPSPQHLVLDPTKTLQEDSYHSLFLRKELEQWKHSLLQRKDEFPLQVDKKATNVYFYAVNLTYHAQ